MFEQQPILDRSIFLPERSHGYCPIRATRGSLPRRHYLLDSSTGNKDGSMELMVLRLRPAPTQFPTNILYTPVSSNLDQVFDARVANGCCTMSTIALEERLASP